MLDDTRGYLKISQWSCSMLVSSPVKPQRQSQISGMVQVQKRTQTINWPSLINMINDIPYFKYPQFCIVKINPYRTIAKSRRISHVSWIFMVQWASNQLPFMARLNRGFASLIDHESTRGTQDALGSRLGVANLPLKNGGV